VTPTIIGIDPHKRSHTAVVLDTDEAITAQLRIPADRRQTDRLLTWAAQWPERIWAVENTNGLGRLLAQQLVRHGETVVDVPATGSARTRRLSGHSGRKTDEHDARSVAIAAAGNRRGAPRAARGLLGRARAARRPPLAFALPPSKRPSAGYTRSWPNSSPQAPSWVCRSLKQPNCCGHCGR
jgi:transposase